MSKGIQIMGTGEKERERVQESERKTIRKREICRKCRRGGGGGGSDMGVLMPS